MATEDDNAEGKPSEDPTGGLPEGEPSKTFTQEDLTRIAAREKDQGKRSGQREILDLLGIDSVEGVQEYVKKQEDAESARMSEADKAKAAADKDRAEAEDIRAEAVNERYNARVERELLKAGVADGAITKVSRLIDAEVASNAEEIATAVADLKAEMPQLFSPGDAGTPKPKSDPGKAPKKSADNDPGKRARSRLEQRHGASLKK